MFTRFDTNVTDGQTDKRCTTTLAALMHAWRGKNRRKGSKQASIFICPVGVLLPILLGEAYSGPQTPS